MILLKDYDCLIMYHHRKAKMVVDALSRKLMGIFAHITKIRRPRTKVLQIL